MGKGGAEAAVRLVAPFEAREGADVGGGGKVVDIREGAQERVVVVELQVASGETRDAAETAVAPWKEGNSDDYANETGFTD